MKNKIVVLGAGLVGSAIAKDLAPRHNVTSADISKDALDRLSDSGIHGVVSDLAKPGQLENLISDADLVIGAVPGFMGYDVARRVIEAGKNMVDISFFPEDPFGLSAIAEKKGVTVVTDCGVAPGMGNIILGYHDTHMEVNYYECLVGGLPVNRQWPWEYKAVFSPIDVIEEYTRPARYVVNGKEVVKEALSDAELVEFPGLGTLESWNSDGLRSLIATMSHIPDMIEKTLRYPGCIEYLRVLRAAGFFSYEEIDVKGKKIRPIDLTASLLFPQWKLGPGEEDFTVMRIDIRGKKNGKNLSCRYMLVDRFDKQSGTISMARTTGFTCAAVAELVLKGQYARKGISPPEFVGRQEGCFDFIIKYLSERGVHYQYAETSN